MSSASGLSTVGRFRIHETAPKMLTDKHDWEVFLGAQCLLQVGLVHEMARKVLANSTIRSNPLET
jgi:hypothetical protein